jgi:hypothetical protein
VASAWSNEDSDTKAAVVNSQLAIGCYQLADAMLKEREGSDATR